ncbi:MAG: hypothetical protein ABSC11_07880 [Smithella sp.]|jgi:hypothetical protein
MPTKLAKDPVAHPVGERIMNKQFYLTGDCHLQIGHYKQKAI